MVKFHVYVLSDFQQYLKQDVPKITFQNFVNQFLTIYTLNDVKNFKCKRLEVYSPTTVNIQFRTSFST